MSDADHRDEREAPGTALERRAAVAALPQALVTDDEIRRLYRISEALATSQAFKGVNSAEKAFAKMIIGRDFGMTPAQSMLGLHLVDGGVMVHYAMLARFIRARADEGYDFRSGWIKIDPGEGEVPSKRVTVWMADEDPADDRDVVGATVQYTIDGTVVGTSTYTLADAQKANLIKDDPRAAWNTSPRNMLLARAMSNGVKWYVPEVMGGLPIYVEGELVPQPSVTEAVGSGEAQGLDLGPKVDAIIERATELGHAGLSDRPSLEIALGNRAPGVVNTWLKDAKAELDRFEAAQQAEEGEPPDAEVVEEGEEGVAGDQRAETLREELARTNKQGKPDITTEEA